MDESFTEVVLNMSADGDKNCSVAMEPYGNFTKSSSGREWVGRYRTNLTPLFWNSLATSLQCSLSMHRVLHLLRAISQIVGACVGVLQDESTTDILFLPPKGKQGVRGGNAHHQLESAFKSFARAFRSALDRMLYGGAHDCVKPSAGPSPPAVASSHRHAERQRSTKETAIKVIVDLDAPWSLDDRPTGFMAAWSGKWMTPKQLQATTQDITRISSGGSFSFVLFLAVVREGDLTIPLFKGTWRIVGALLGDLNK